MTKETIKEIQAWLDDWDQFNGDPPTTDEWGDAGTFEGTAYYLFLKILEDELTTNHKVFEELWNWNKKRSANN